MQNSLKEISNKLQYFANNHSNINEYNCDDYTKFSSKDHLYPLLWATPTNLTIQNGIVQYTLNIALMNLVYEHADMIKVLSDLGDIFTQLITYIDEDSENNFYFISLDTPINGLPFFRQIDGVAGFQADVVFTLRFGANTNEIAWK